MKRRAATIIVAGTMLTGCATTDTAPNSYTTADDIIDDIRSSGFDCELDQYDAELFAGMTTSCITDQNAIVARAFSTTEDYDTYVEGMTGPVIFGDLWAVECTDMEECEHVHGVTGGEFKG